MVVGDVVNGIGLAATTITFQPAVGVECMISFVAGSATSPFGITDGVTYSDPVTSTSRINDMTNMKIFINNTNYLFAQSSAIPRSYSGIQIK